MTDPTSHQSPDPDPPRCGNFAPHGPHAWGVESHEQCPGHPVAGPQATFGGNVIVGVDPGGDLADGVAYYAEHAQPPVQEQGYAPGGVVWPLVSEVRSLADWPAGRFDPRPPEIRDAEATTERMIEAERLAADARHETGGSPEWHAVVSELLDHLTGGYKQNIQTECPPMEERLVAPFTSCHQDPLGESPSGSGFQHGDQTDPPTAETAKTGAVVPPEPVGRRDLLTEVRDLARGLAIPHDIQPGPQWDVLVTADASNEMGLFAWAERIEEQRADLRAECGPSMLGGEALVTVTARAAWF